MAWTTPRDWVSGEVVTASKMQQNSDNLVHLYARPSLILTIRGNGSNETSTSTVFVPINNTILSGSLVTTQAALSLNFNASVSHSVATTQIAIDILIDGTTYASSLTSTAVTNGLWVPRSGNVASSAQLSGSHIIPAGSLTVGVHTFAVVWRAVAAGTITLTLSGSSCQFSVMEV